MQGINPEQLSSMIGYEYQLFVNEPPLYVIRKVQRTSMKDVIPMSYYYILHGVVYQAPDLMSVLSSRLQMTTHYLDECLETAFNHYRYNPTKGYYWDFNQHEENKPKDPTENRPTIFQRDRVDLLLTEFSTRFPPFKPQEIQEPTKSENLELNEPSSVESKDQPVEKKMKLHVR
jgi:mediator of RNA polymerase II transcription subunit 6